MPRMIVKMMVWAGVGILFSILVTHWDAIQRDKSVAAAAVSQMNGNGNQAMREVAFWETAVTSVGFWLWVLALPAMFYGELKAMFNKRNAVFSLMVGLLLTSTGCYKPYHVPVFQTIETSEEGFLIPLSGDEKNQASTPTEDLLEKCLVQVKEVEIPHHWVQMGYRPENGEWRPSFRLVKVDRAPVTREWTADPNSGTSNKNEAIWVMTSDGVAFSTGWTCTARIANKKDAVKFLFNYPSGTLKEVLDTEVRAKLQSQFGLAVTDRPMDELRIKSTPIFTKVADEVVKFFQERGISITTLGITGGYVYQDKHITETLNKVFVAQQEQQQEMAKTKAQEEANKRIKMEAEGKVAALRLEAEGKAEAAKIAAKGEAEAVKERADATAYETEKIAQNPEIFMQIRRLELEGKKQEKWDGRFPMYYMGGGAGNTPDLLLNVPMVAPIIEKKESGIPLKETFQK